MPDVVHLRGLVVLSSLFSIIVLVMFSQRFSALKVFYENKAPDFGGTYREGVVGSVNKINPLFIQSSVEASASRLVFAGLTKVMTGSEVIPDMAENWTISEDKKSYKFILKENLKWQDGEPLTADDVIFTINLIQNPDTKTTLSTVWKNVTVEKVNDREVIFVLPNSYNNFLVVASQPLLPEHLLRDIEPRNFKVSEFNLKPVGSGPYAFLRFDQVANETELVFEANQYYLPHKPYISTVKLRLYSTFDELYNGFVRKQIDGVTEIPLDKVEEIKNLGNLDIHKLFLPRYEVVVFNLKNEYLKEKAVRIAIAKAINRKEIVDKVLNNQANITYTVFLPGQPGYDPKYNVDSYNVEAANQELETLGWLKNENGIREKDGKPLTFRFVSIDDNENKEVAETICKQLKNIGIQTETILIKQELMQSDVIRPRNFDIILLGQSIGGSADLYSFWHSSQINDPGLNISSFNDRMTDKLLELARKSSDNVYIDDKYSQIQQILATEVPAIPLYNPLYAFGMSNNIKGFYAGKISEPVDHLNNISEWYIKEKVSN
jgi:peptide/nickel transport system substrate-binding protein